MRVTPSLCATAIVKLSADPPDGSTNPKQVMPRIAPRSRFHAVRRLSMNQRAPAAIVVSARLGTPVRRPLRRGQDVVGPGTARHVSVAPVHVENLAEGVGARLTSRAIRARYQGLLGGEVRQGRGLLKTQGGLSISFQRTRAGALSKRFRRA